MASGSSPHTRGARLAHSACCPGNRDHPRIRGEHGTLHNVDAGHDGIIPAYAGSTSSSADSSATSAGSSPHTRGAPRLFARDCRQPRIIPAYAGSTLVLPRSRFQSWGSSPHTRGAQPRRKRCRTASWDHPRIRGEHRAPGSRQIRCVGIIPAYAGSTLCSVQRRLSDPGSSPHTRGAPLAAPALGSGYGIIPAYAGSTSKRARAFANLSGSSPHTRGAPIPSRSACPRGGDHPRIRGEHEVPRLDCVVGDRIIPAYAGSTMHMPRFSESMLDHPRIRGEHPDGIMARLAAAGIIPAYAGSTLSTSA